MYVSVDFFDVQWFGKIRVPADEFFAKCGDEPGPRRVDLLLKMGDQPGLGSTGIWDGEIKTDGDEDFVEITMPAMLGAPRWLNPDE